MEYGCRTHLADHITYYGQADGDSDADGDDNEEDRRVVGLVEDGRRTIRLVPDEPNAVGDFDHKIGNFDQMTGFLKGWVKLDSAGSVCRFYQYLVFTNRVSTYN
jgi:hypothetical protein